jgi:hypothetical protein
MEFEQARYETDPEVVSFLEQSYSHNLLLAFYVCGCNVHAFTLQLKQPI